MRAGEDLSNVNAFGLGLTLLMGILIVALPRRHVIYPIFVTALYITLGQVAVIMGFHFSMMRVMIIFVWLRFILRREFEFTEFNAIDKSIIIYGISAFITYILLWGTYESFKNRLGFAYNTFGLYFMFRLLIKDFDDIEGAIKALAILVAPIAIGMLIEVSTGKNWFSALGGVTEDAIVRDGVKRCRGPFVHPILAGTFAATALPLFIGMWLKGGKARIVQTIGIVSVTAITLTTVSGGAVTSFMASVAGFFVWKFRTNMRQVRWMCLFAIVGLTVFMKAPIWYILAKLSSIVGGGGWHRSYLIDQAMNHIGEWWLVGTKVTAHWMPYALSAYPDQADITNQFIGVGVDGGLISMLLFIVCIGLCFSGLGRSLEPLWDKPLSQSVLAWSMGVALFSHVMSFMGVAYADQIIVSWYLLLAMISLVSSMSEEDWEQVFAPKEEEEPA